MDLCTECCGITFITALQTFMPISGILLASQSSAETYYYFQYHKLLLASDTIEIAEHLFKCLLQMLMHPAILPQCCFVVVDSVHKSNYGIIPLDYRQWTSQTNVIFAGVHPKAGQGEMLELTFHDACLWLTCTLEFWVPSVDLFGLSLCHFYLIFICGGISLHIWKAKCILFGWGCSVVASLIGS